MVKKVNRYLTKVTSIRIIMEAAKKNRTQVKRRFTRISSILVQTIEFTLLVKTVEN